MYYLLFMYLFIYLFIYLLIYLFIYLFIYSFIYFYTYLFIYSFIYFIYQSIFPLFFWPNPPKGYKTLPFGGFGAAESAERVQNTINLFIPLFVHVYF